MWPFDPSSMLSTLRDIRSLLIEQTNLTREMATAVLGRPPSTPPTIRSQTSDRPRPPRQFTVDDVHVVTREDRHNQAIKELEEQLAPWRTTDANETDADEPALPEILAPVVDSATPTSRPSGSPPLKGGRPNAVFDL